MDTRRLIVNADDLGWTAGVNDGIFEAHTRGVVSSATLMVNTPGAEHAAAALARPELAGLGVGLHVALTGGGRPALPAAEVPSLVDGDGRLPRRPENLTGAQGDDIRREVRAQLARFEDLVGRLPTHFDGHHHVHWRRREVGAAVIELALETGLPVRHVTGEMRLQLAAAGVRTTDRFDPSFFAAEASLANLAALLRGLEPGVSEIMCHPGLVDAELAASSTYTETREVELAVLTDPSLPELLAAEGIDLVDYRVLSE